MGLKKLACEDVYGKNCLQLILLWTRVNMVVRVCEDAYWNNLLAMELTVDSCKHGSRPWVSLEGEENLTIWEIIILGGINIILWIFKHESESGE